MRIERRKFIDIEFKLNGIPNGRVKLFSISKNELIINITKPNPKSSEIVAKNIITISVTAFFF